MACAIKSLNHLTKKRISIPVYVIIYAIIFAKKMSFLSTK